MKVASGKKVMNYLLDNYGDTKVKDILQQEYVNAKNSKYNKKIMKMIDQDGEFKVKDLYFDELTKDISYNKTTFGQHNKDVFSKDPDTAFAATRYNTTIEVGGKFVAEYLMKNEKTKKETLDYFAKKGYDAIIDVDDARFLSEFPLILLNPKNTTTKVFSEEFRKKKTKIADEPIKIK